jgi:cobalt/nickel transport system permease protein
MGGRHALERTGVACDPASVVRTLDPRAKLVGLLAVTAVAVSTPLAAWPAWGACAGVLAAYAIAGGVPAGVVWRRWRVLAPVIVLAGIFLPFVRTGGTTHALGPLTVHDAGLTTLAELTAKAGIGTLGAVLLGATAAFPEVLRGLEALRTPRLLVLVAAFMYRYLFVIADEVGRMRSAIAARGYAPRSALGIGALGRLVAALFLRTHARGERVYLAMLARGYTGAMPGNAPLTLRAADIAFVALVLAVILPARVLA